MGAAWYGVFFGILPGGSGLEATPGLSRQGGSVVGWWGGGVARPHCVVGWFGWLRPESCDAGRKQGNSDKCDGMMVVMVTIMSRVIVWPCANLLKSIKP